MWERGRIGECEDGRVGWGILEEDVVKVHGREWVGLIVDWIPFLLLAFPLLLPRQVGADDEVPDDESQLYRKAENRGERSRTVMAKVLVMFGRCESNSPDSAMDFAAIEERGVARRDCGLDRGCRVHAFSGLAERTWCWFGWGVS
jgi:hypothetical protein